MGRLLTWFSECVDTFEGFAVGFRRLGNVAMHGVIGQGYGERPALGNALGGVTVLVSALCSADKCHGIGGEQNGRKNYQCFFHVEHYTKSDGFSGKIVGRSRWFSISLRPLRSLRLNPLKEDRQREVVCAKFAHAIATLGINLQNLQIIQNSH